MTQQFDLNQPIYQAGQTAMSMGNLLAYFVDPNYQRGNLSRISDMHVKVGRPVSFRIDDDLTPVPEGADVTDEVIRYMLGIILNEKHLETLAEDEPSDIDSGYEWVEGGVNFRLNVFHDRDGLAFVMRVLSSIIPDIETLGLPSEQIWRDITSLKRGLVLVTGVTGSGKSTTIAALINHVNRFRKTRIITLEDPVEFIFKSESSMVSQRQVGQNVETFSGGLRSALRENPDVIFVGEIRDQETATLALSAAETGHLVFSTLHTRDAKGALSRIVDMFPAEQTKSLCLQLSFSLSSVLSQKLVPRADGSGRILVMEVLKNVPAIGNLIRTGNWQQVYSTMETQQKEGMMTMEQHLEHLYKHGIISKENAITYANEASLIDRIAKLEAEAK
ncbi:MAG: twitching motility protein [Opitutae bacterium]|nr:twitching motility protein [Opitutae bacterium]|tara:strand:- start:5142 stop:6308 length:1167 start_codon:yes stop_codon:yes gene_type:complete